MSTGETNDDRQEGKIFITSLQEQIIIELGMILDTVKEIDRNLVGAIKVLNNTKKQGLLNGQAPTKATENIEQLSNFEELQKENARLLGNILDLLH